VVQALHAASTPPLQPAARVALVTTLREPVGRVLSAYEFVVEVGAYSDAKVAIRNIRVWHGATENGP
jgi:hypothetical protein